VESSATCYHPQRPSLPKCGFVVPEGSQDSRCPDVRVEAGAVSSAKRLSARFLRYLVAVAQLPQYAVVANFLNGVNNEAGNLTRGGG
jgi:hypothetical protein